MAAGLRVRRVHSPDPGRCACQLRSVGGSVHQQQSHRLAVPTVELRQVRRGHAPVHQQRAHQRLQRPVGSELLPWHPRTVGQVRQPGQILQADSDAGSTARAERGLRGIGDRDDPWRLRQRRSPQGRVGSELRPRHAYRQPKAQRIRSIRARRFHPKRERDRAQPATPCPALPNEPACGP